jgi:hypothetical protein
MQQFEDGSGEGKSAIFGMVSSETGQKPVRRYINAQPRARNPSDGGGLAIVARAASLEMIEISRQTAT